MFVVQTSKGISEGAGRRFCGGEPAAIHLDSVTFPLTVGHCAARAALETSAGPKLCCRPQYLVSPDHLPYGSHVKFVTS